MGDGVDCIAFSTCNHVFDYKCIVSKVSFNKL